MKSKWTLLWIVVCGVLFFSAGSLIVSQTDDDGLFEKRTALVMRDIGHQILLHAHDSTSRILPVSKKGPHLFQIEFQSQFTFVPDTLVKIVHQNLASAHLPLAYTVNVFDSRSKQVIYGYEMQPKEKDIVPCLGRVQPVGSYLLQIEFTDHDPFTARHDLHYFFIMLSAGLALFAFTGKRTFGKKKKTQLPESGPAFPHVGEYVFYFDKRILKNGEETIELSDKESKVLRIFATHPNELVERERLMKEVWEDDGVFVGRSLDVFVSKLRKKLQGDPSVKITNVHGKGYKLETDTL